MADADITQNHDAANSRAGYIAMIATAIAVWLIRFVPFLFPEARLWGINHLLFLPGIYGIIYAGLGILAISCLIPAISRRLEVLFDRVGSILFGAPKFLRWGLLGVAALIIFLILRMPTHFLGDGYPLVQNIAGDLPTVFKWSEMGAVRVIHLVSQIIPMQGQARGEYAYAVVSVIAGALTVTLLCGIAYELGRNAAERLWIWLMACCSGYLLLFFGYAENYPALWPVMAGYIYFGIRYLKGKRSLVYPAVFLLAALILHLQILFFCLSFLALAAAKGPWRGFHKRHRNAAWWTAGIGAAVIVILFAYLYQAFLIFRIHFIPFIHGRPPADAYTLFSIAHLADIGNELLLTIPLWPALVVMLLPKLRGRFMSPEGRFLAMTAVGGLLLLALLDPKLGMGRDWDLFALAGLTGGLLLVYGAAAREQWKKHFPVLVVLSAVTVFPYFAANLGYDSSIGYYNWLLRLDHPRSRAGMVILRDFYEASGDKQKADSLTAAATDRFPVISITTRAYSLANDGHLAEAQLLADSAVRLDPYSIETLNLRGTIFLMAGNYERAITEFEMSEKSQPYYANTLTKLAKAYQRSGRRQDMMKALRRAQRYSPNLPDVLEGLALAFFSEQRYDSAFACGSKLIQAVPGNSRGYLAAGLAAYRLNRRDEATAYLTRFLDMAPNDREAPQVREILLQLQSMK